MFAEQVMESNPFWSYIPNYVSVHLYRCKMTKKLNTSEYLHEKIEIWIPVININCWDVFLLHSIVEAYLSILQLCVYFVVIYEICLLFYQISWIIPNKPHGFKTLTERTVPLVNIYNFLSTFVIYLVALKAKKSWWKGSTE